MVAKDVVNAIREAGHEAVQHLHGLLIHPLIIKEVPCHGKHIRPLPGCLLQ